MVKRSRWLGYRYARARKSHGNYCELITITRDDLLASFVDVVFEDEEYLCPSATPPAFSSFTRIPSSVLLSAVHLRRL